MIFTSTHTHTCESLNGGHNVNYHNKTIDADRVAILSKQKKIMIRKMM